MNKDIRPDKTSPAYLKNKNSGGLFKGFLYVLLFMSILSLAIWQNYSSSSTSSKIQSTEDRLAIIEEQMNIADEVNNDSLTDISSSIQFLDKEIRKLWDLSNKKNKINISKLKDSNNDFKKSIEAINQLLSEHKIQIDTNTLSINESEPLLNNLKNIEIQIPLGVMIGVTGVSGSGKSTLINETLYPILNVHIYNGVKTPLPYKKIEGLKKKEGGLKTNKGTLKNRRT